MLITCTNIFNETWNSYSTHLKHTFEAKFQNKNWDLEIGGKGGGVQGVVKEDLMPIPHQQKIRYMAVRTIY